MNTSTRRLLSGLAATVLALGQSVLVLAASPQPGASAPSGPTGSEMLSVQPSLVSVSVKPGSTSTIELTLRAAAALDINVKSQGLAQGVDGSFKAVPAESDSSPYSARAMISATPSTFSVKPGDTVKLAVTIAVPESVGEGTRYSILTVTGLPAGPGASSNVGFGVELGVSTIIQIAGTAQTKNGSIRTIDVGKSLPGQPLPVTVSFANTGNSHYGALPNELVTTATLQDSTGAQLAAANASGNQLSVIPSFSRDVALSMAPSKALVDGARYHLEVGVGLKDGTIFDRKALDFTWSGGEVLSATSAPVQVPPAAVTSPAPSDPLLMLVAGAMGAVAVLFLVWVRSRIRRRSSANVDVIKA